MTQQGRVALVTGGNRGIGGAIAVGLAGDGLDLAVSYRKDEESARATVAAIEQLGRRAIAYQAPVDDVEAATAMAEGVLADFGRVDVLVHSAGVASRGLTVADTEPAEIERLFRVQRAGRVRAVQGARPADADARPRRCRPDLECGNDAHGGELVALQHGQGGARGARTHAGQGGAPPRHPRQRRRARPRPTPRWVDVSRGPRWAPRTSTISTRDRRSGTCAVPRRSPTSCASSCRTRRGT